MTLPPFTDNALDRLRHTLAAYEDSPDDRVVLDATRDGRGNWTGLTLGDLRVLSSLWSKLEPPPNPDPMWVTPPIETQEEAEEFVDRRLRSYDMDPENYYVTGIARRLRDAIGSWNIRHVTASEFDRAAKNYTRAGYRLTPPLSTSEE